MPGVQLKRVTKVHRGGSRGGEVVALRAATVAIEDGKCTVVVGPSGSGKTTLLRLIAGLEEPTSGELEVGGRSMTGVPSRERGVAMVFQDHPLFPHLDVAGNLALGLKLRHVPQAEQSFRLREVTEWLGLDRLLDRMSGTLSGGERQRVALGMALVQRPRLLLLDEPLAHLDARWRLQLRREFRSLQRRLGLTWVQVTHDQSEALALADRLVVLESGTVQQVGTPTEVYGRPSNRFVAEFLGSPGMNLLSGRLSLMEAERWEFQVVEGEVMRGGGCRAGIVSHGRKGILPGDTPALADAEHRFIGGRAGHEPGPRWMGFRPEAVHLDDEMERGDGGMEDQVWAMGEVSVVEPMGHETWVHVRVGTNGWLVARASGLGRWQPGDRVRVTIPSNAVHWFDATSGSRMA